MALKQKTIKFYLVCFFALWIIPGSIVLAEMKYGGIPLTGPLLLKAGTTFILPALVGLIVIASVAWAQHRNSKKKA